MKSQKVRSQEVSKKYELTRLGGVFQFQMQWRRFECLKDQENIHHSAWSVWSGSRTTFPRILVNFTRRWRRRWRKECKNPKPAEYIWVDELNEKHSSFLFVKYSCSVFEQEHHWSPSWSHKGLQVWMKQRRRFAEIWQIWSTKDYKSRNDYNRIIGAHVQCLSANSFDYGLLGFTRRWWTSSWAACENSRRRPQRSPWQWTESKRNVSGETREAQNSNNKIWKLDSPTCCFIGATCSGSQVCSRPESFTRVQQRVTLKSHRNNSDKRIIQSVQRREINRFIWVYISTKEPLIWCLHMKISLTILWWCHQCYLTLGLRLSLPTEGEGLERLGYLGCMKGLMKGTMELNYDKCSTHFFCFFIHTRIKVRIFWRLLLLIVTALFSNWSLVIPPT